ncbi:proteasome assembly chaperone family protein [Methanothermococcus sp.]|uniref:proteasome assembly chaperone family protein n=1 Tax=Methanothermococcus sp. TaxID=2614238 RepID=UPI0025E96B3C|nr:proteasome assembly chaperone family protein [Methanothermococcus sp.]
MDYVIKKEPDFKEPIVITGFPSIGLIGNIATHQIVKELNLDFIGYFDSPNIPPVMSVEKGIIYPPIRAYGNENLVVISSDVLIPPNVVYELTDKLIEYISKINPKIVINLDGITSLNPKNIYAVSTSNELLEFMVKQNIPILEYGMVGGMSGAISIKSSDKNISSLCLMAETPGLRPDPMAASNIIEVLNKLYDLNVNTEELIKEDEKIKEKLRKLAEEHLKLMSKQKVENPMYL